MNETRLCLLLGADSNVAAGKLFGIPLRGTHSHAFVSSFMVRAKCNRYVKSYRKQNFTYSPSNVNLSFTNYAVYIDVCVKKLLGFRR